MSDLVLLLIAIVPLVVLLIRAMLEVARRSDLGAQSRIGWFGVLLLVPVGGLMLYTILRPASRPTTTTASGGGTDAELFVEIAERRQRKKLDDAGYVAAVKSLVATPTGARRNA